MWAFRQFPDKIELLDGDSCTYQVEVFGYLPLKGGLVEDKALIVFRQNVLVNYQYIAEREEIGNIQLLPSDEFEEKFKEYRLVERF